MRRIVEETLADKTKQYRVEKNTRFFGLIKSDWHTDTFYVGEAGFGSYLDAVFTTLDEAEAFAYGKPKNKEVVERKVISNSETE
jgi:hypothetical protein